MSARLTLVRVLAGAVLLGALVAVLALAGGASAASGITPLAPVRDATVPKGKAPAFRMRVHGSGEVWVRVCSSPARTGSGLICPSESLGRATRGRAGVATYRPKVFGFPGFWLNRPGTYYWQGCRIACVRGDCRQAGLVVRFKVG